MKVENKDIDILESILDFYLESVEILECDEDAKDYVNEYDTPARAVIAKLRKAIENN